MNEDKILAELAEIKSMLGEVLKPIRKAQNFAYTDEFEAMWSLWPAREVPGGRLVKNGKRQAFETWVKVRGAAPRGEDMLQIIKDHIEIDLQHRNPKYIPMLSTWLNDGRWADVFEDTREDEIQPTVLDEIDFFIGQQLMANTFPFDAKEYEAFVRDKMEMVTYNEWRREWKNE
jgi:hypothetical protein